MDTFDHVLNWKLKAGSHLFPSPDGGTCINEAALVAAGFEYKAIRSAADMPECFSRPICHLAMVLNDQVGDNSRQRLLPYVMRLACADTAEIEQERAEYIQRHTRGYPYGIPFEVGLKALDGALAIGRQADPLGPDEVKTRLDEARTKPPTRTVVPESGPSAPDGSFLTKVRHWFKAKEPA
jgi:hypothetical protein